MKATTQFYRLISGALCVSAVCWPLQAAADATVPSAGSVVEFDVLVEPGVVDLFGDAAVIAEALDNSRGGTDYFLNDIKSDGVVRDNQASNLTTGDNWVTAGSFSGAAGFPTVVQNSGNNVLIQNATIINLQVH